MISSTTILSPGDPRCVARRAVSHSSLAPQLREAASQLRQLPGCYSWHVLVAFVSSLSGPLLRPGSCGRGSKNKDMSLAFNVLRISLSINGPCNLIVSSWLGGERHGSPCEPNPRGLPGVNRSRRCWFLSPPGLTRVAIPVMATEAPLITERSPRSYWRLFPIHFAGIWHGLKWCPRNNK